MAELNRLRQDDAAAVTGENPEIVSAFVRYLKALETGSPEDINREGRLLHAPSEADIQNSNLTAFARFLEQRIPGLDFGADYPKLWRFSVKEPEAFWSAVWDFCGVIGDKGERVLIDGDKMPGAKFFPDAKINFAENLLRDRPDTDVVIAYRSEDKIEQKITFGELKQRVASLAAYLRDEGVVAGDRVAAFIPNMPEAIIGMLASASTGAIWSSAAPEFGVNNVMERFEQVEPKVLISADGYWFKGNKMDSLKTIREVQARLPSVKKTLIIPSLDQNPSLEGFDSGTELWTDALKRHPDAELKFERFDFNQPLYIMYTSGTTGKPKCILHGAGGTLLKHLMEHQLQCDIKPDDNVFYATTTGWMMWNWLVTALASKAKVMVYDGFFGLKDSKVLFEFAQQEKFTFFGTAAGFIHGIMNSGFRPNEEFDLSSIKTITSTGSVLSPAGFVFCHQHFAHSVPPRSISGGTDMLGCAVGGNPWMPMHVGEIQAPVLGMASMVYAEEGEPLFGMQGELVITKPFPSMPLGFWNDPAGQKYRGAYYEDSPGVPFFRLEPNVWKQGDDTRITPLGGFVISGRSDSVLNVGGNRIGTAEIYNEIIKLPEIAQSCVIEHKLSDKDSQMVLFVQMKPGQQLTDELQKTIRDNLRKARSPRHVPAVILAVPDLPLTMSGKLSEKTVRDLVHGRTVTNASALSNPGSMEHFRNIPELQTSGPVRAQRQNYVTDPLIEMFKRVRPLYRAPIIIPGDDGKIYARSFSHWMIDVPNVLRKAGTFTAATLLRYGREALRPGRARQSTRDRAAVSPTL